MKNYHFFIGALVLFVVFLSAFYAADVLLEKRYEKKLAAGETTT